jgi:hypothetical protein
MSLVLLKQPRRAAQQLSEPVLVGQEQRVFDAMARSPDPDADACCP